VSGPLEIAPRDDARRPRRRGSRDLVAVSPLKDWTCSGCGAESGDLLVMRDAGPLCLSCADMDHLVFQWSGDAALTRRARKHSGLSAVVVRFSRARKRYERQGVLVEQEALERAEAECLADEELRARRREREAERRAGEDVEFQRQLAAEIRGCSRAARLSGRSRSPRTPDAGAADASGAQPPAAPWIASRDARGCRRGAPRRHPV
jgi:hypothetical protein